MSKKLIDKLIKSEKEDANTVVVSFRLPRKTKENLDFLANETGRNKSTIARDIFDEVLGDAIERLKEKGGEHGAR